MKNSRWTLGLSALMSVFLFLGCVEISLAPVGEEKMPQASSLFSAGPNADSTKIIVTGDLGGAGGAEVKSLVQTYYQNPGVAMALTAGDNAYGCGSLSDFNSKFDPNWGSFLFRSGAQWVFPGTGHHDWGSSGAAGYSGCSVYTPADGFALYMSNHQVPEYGNGLWYYAKDIPGVPWRIIQLSGTINAGSNIITGKGQPLVSNVFGSPQYNWFKSQLVDAAEKGIMCVVVWSDPYYATKDNHHVGEPKMKPFWKLLYKYRPGSAIVLNGHKHNYERFAPQDENGNRTNKGIVEIVAGTGGNGHYPFETPAASNSLFRNDTHWGVVELTLWSSGVTVKFVSSAPGYPVLDNVWIDVNP